MTRGIYLPSFVAIGWAVLTLSWGRVKLCPASVAWWPWPKVTEMGANNFSNTHRLTMCGLKKLSSGVFTESWKVLAERLWWLNDTCQSQYAPFYQWSITFESQKTIHEPLLTHWHHMVMEIWVNIGSVNGLLPDGTKPLLEPMLTYHQLGPVAIILAQYHKIWRHQWMSKTRLKIAFLNITSRSSGDQRVNEKVHLTFGHGNSTSHNLYDMPLVPINALTSIVV